MSTVLTHNTLALTAQRNLWHHQQGIETAITRLSSGLRINYSWDDPAGLGISERFRAQISSMTEAERNANADMNVVATAEGALSVINNILIRMKALSIQASNGAMTDFDRFSLDVEYQQLKSEITRIANTTQYGSFNLLDGSYSATGIKFHVGIHNTHLDDYYFVQFNSMTAESLGIGASSLLNTASAQAAIMQLDSAIDVKDSERVRLGSYVERLQYTISAHKNINVSTVKSESDIRDADIAEEMGNLTRNQILMQAGVAMVAQANMIPQIVAGLIG